MFSTNFSKFSVYSLSLSCCFVLSCTIHSAAAAETMQLQPFSTDGCSLFPDRSPTGEADWCECCVQHDLAYWRGGTEAERLQADRELYTCVKKKTANEQLAQWMFSGVRSAGGPHHYTSYRWGYGWPYGRFYQAISPAEREQVERLSAQISTAQMQQVCHKTDSK